ncbi:MAG: mechanosensitive ion channel protein MscS [Betaproteobacteria bacterium HGW-Betaproteobacteria-1]|jgi:small conductance mechanosensitive channel|nr:MAG: mechanosensitive ion channel protein MscS [Betaproteobacteria bacterium HGW-Betaproteobacteria-1]
MSEHLEILDQAKSTAVDLAIQFGPKVLVAIAIIIAGVYIGRWIGNISNKALSKINLELPVQELLVRIIRIIVLGMFIIMALQNLGIQLLPLIAGLGVAGAGVALAMQGVLGNIMAGLTIIFTKPFRVGEYISIAEEEGLVENISLFSTVLGHYDQSQVVIPNRKIVGEILHNFGEIRQLDINVGVAYDTDLDKALAIINEILQKNLRVLKEPQAIVTTNKLATSSIEIAVKPWIKVPDYIFAKGEITKAIVESFRSENIVIPFSQHEIRILENKSIESGMKT